MGMYYYNTDLGVFSLIVGDDVYAAIHNYNLQSTEIFDGTSVTQTGREIIDILGLGDFRLMTLCSPQATEIDVDRLNSIRLFIPQLEIAAIEDADYTRKTVTLPVNNNSDRCVKFSYNLDGFNENPVRLNLYNEYLTVNGTDLSTGQFFPYPAYTTTNISGDTLNYCYITFFVADSSLSNFEYCCIPLGSNDYDNFRFIHDGANSTVTDNLNAFFTDLQPITPDDDPMSGGGTSTGGVGGGGDFDNTSTPVDIPALPTLSAVNAGFITLYRPSVSQLSTFASYLWSGAFDLDTFKKLFNDPMESVLGLSIIPVSPSATATALSLGNITTSILVDKCTEQYVSVDCGSLNVNEYWGAYLDYSPYTKAEIYLPYVGVRALDIDDIMGKTVHVVYHVDILSGSCVAYVKCGDSVLYSFLGQCSSSIPISGSNWTNMINGVLSIAGAIGTTVATGGAAAPMAVGTIASTATNSMKPQIEKSGSVSGAGGMLGIQTPYIIMTRPRQCLPDRQNSFIGYPSYVTVTLGAISGYTIVDSIHLENVPATSQELSEIESILKTGVIF